MNFKESKDVIEIVDEHLEDYFDDNEILVFHEKDTPEGENHIDIYWIKPVLEGTDYSILLTVGMSRIDMEVDLEIEYRPKLVEIAMLVPKTWDFKNMSWKDPEYWPIQHLKTIAKIPSRQKTWIGYGHTISWDNTGSLIPGTRFNSSMVLHSRTLSEEFTKIKLEDEREIQIYSLLPLYPEELDFKIEFSSSRLVDKFNEFDVSEIVDIDRINTCIS